MATSVHVVRARLIACAVLFVMWPLAQSVVPRALPTAFGLFLVILLSGHAIARWKNMPGRSLLDPRKISSGWPRLALATALLFVAWAAVALLWSPMPQRGAKDVASLVVVFLATPFVVHEFERSKFIIGWVIASLLISSVLLLSDMFGVSTLHKLVLDTNELFDLNRNALWVLIMMSVLAGMSNSPGSRGFRPAIIFALVVGTVAVFSSESEAAKLALILAALAFAAARFARNLARIIVATISLAVIAMPLIVPALSNATDSGFGFARQAHVEHRVALWQGYAGLVAQKPILGWGTKADRMLGETGMAGDAAERAGYSRKTTSPHNAALEVWVNQGLIGATLLCLSLLFAGLAVCDLRAGPRAAMMIVVTALASVCMTATSVYQGWWLLTMTVGVSLVTALTRRFWLTVGSNAGNEGSVS